MVEEGGAGKLMALLKAGPNHPVTPHAARALQSLACRHPGAQVTAVCSGHCVRSCMPLWQDQKPRHLLRKSAVCLRMPQEAAAHCF